MGSLFGSPDKGPSPQEIAEQNRANKIGELRSARDLARIRSQRTGTLNLLNPGLKVPGQGGGGSSGGL